MMKTKDDLPDELSNDWDTHHTEDGTPYYETNH